ncbi:cyclophilin-like family protein [Tenacibaculum sp. 190524A05c]|uniref:Cyclophil_like domain-containing protein n=1 Tax=Tenacibaculum platacis TaxID=3137852 RepID=A0ABP1EV30_9FLAO
MNNILSTEEFQLEIEWDLNSGIINSILNSNPIEGVANNIGGEVFFYQYDLDIPFNGEEKEVFEEGDVIYWKSPTDPKKFGILFMYGNTDYGDGTKPRTSSPGIKIGIIKDIKSISKISTGSILKLG